jgi:hypothetical protein
VETICIPIITVWRPESGAISIVERNLQLYTATAQGNLLHKYKASVVVIVIYLIRSSDLDP